MLFIDKYIVSLKLLLIIKLSQDYIILDYLKMKKYKMLLNMINHFILFFLGYYIYFEAFLYPIFFKLKIIKRIFKTK